MMFEVVESLDGVTERVPTVVAVGVFDGVHRGHVRLLERVVAAARELGGRAAVLTFFPHPLEVISGVGGRYYLTGLDERVRLLGETGVDLVVVQGFDEAMRRVRARDFVQQLIEQLDMRQLWGGDFSLGFEREGDLGFLTALGGEWGFEVFEVDGLVMAAGERVSSSRVRRGLACGDVGDVAVCLGRPYSISGVVEMGKQLGRTIGVPTANVGVWGQQIVPANGVYATRVMVGEDVFMAATNVGVRPTVDDGERVTVEAHLLDFDGDLYGEVVRVEFLERIRGEVKFDGLAGLKAQIGRDVARVREIGVSGVKEDGCADDAEGRRKDADKKYE